MPDLSLDLRCLRCALAVSEQGSFRRAASKLELPQSTVSRRVQLLERRLGFALFVPDRRGARFDGLGCRIPEGCNGWRQANRTCGTDRRCSSTRRGGEIRIGILASLTSDYLDSILQAQERELS